MKHLKSRYNLKAKFQVSMVKIFESLLNKEYSDALDVGCGKGFWAYVGARANKYKNIAGCDVFPDMQTDEIKPYVQKIEYANITEESQIPYEDEKFDLVFTIDVIEHVEDQEKFVLELFRVIKPGGVIIIGTPNRYRLTNLFLMLIRRLKYPRKMGEDSYGDVIHLREYSKKDLLTLMTKYSSLYDEESLRIIPCWLGIVQLNLGMKKFPKILSCLSQFWFLSVVKN